jgi:hypothetical protein
VDLKDKIHHLAKVTVAGSNPVFRSNVAGQGRFSTAGITIRPSPDVNQTGDGGCGTCAHGVRHERTDGRLCPAVAGGGVGHMSLAGDAAS